MILPASHTNPVCAETVSIVQTIKVLGDETLSALFFFFCFFFSSLSICPLTTDWLLTSQPLSRKGRVLEWCSKGPIKITWQRGKSQKNRHIKDMPPPRQDIADWVCFAPVKNPTKKPYCMLSFCSLQSLELKTNNNTYPWPAASTGAAAHSKFVSFKQFELSKWDTVWAPNPSSYVFPQLGHSACRVPTGLGPPSNLIARARTSLSIAPVLPLPVKMTASLSPALTALRMMFLQTRAYDNVLINSLLFFTLVCDSKEEPHVLTWACSCRHWFYTCYHLENWHHQKSFSKSSALLLKFAWQDSSVRPLRVSLPLLECISFHSKSRAGAVLMQVLTPAHAYTCALAHAYTCTLAHAYTCALVHAGTHTYTHAHSRTFKWQRLGPYVYICTHTHTFTGCPMVISEWTAKALWIKKWRKLKLSKKVW